MAQGETNIKLRQARVQREWTLEDVACGLATLAHQLGEPEPRANRFQVSKWELGIRNPGLYYRARLCLLFDLSPAELGWPAKPTLLRTVADLRTQLGETGRPRAVATHPDSIIRQEPGTEPLSDIDQTRLTAVLRYGWQVDGPLLRDLERRHERLNARSEVEPPRMIKPDLSRWLGTLEEILERSQPESVGRRVRVMAARAANHLGYLSYRDLQRPEAYRLYALSASFAHEAQDDEELALLVLRKRQLEADTKGLAAAVELVDSIGGLLTADSPSGLTAWRWGERARQESVLGNEREARQYMDWALSAAARDPQRLNLFAPDKDSRWLARRPAYVALKLAGNRQGGDRIRLADEAIRTLEANRADADARLVREIVWNSIELAEGWVVRGDLDNACEYLDDALDRAVETEDRRAVGFIRRVRSTMQTWNGDPRLRAIDSRLRSVTLTAGLTEERKIP